MTDRVAYLAEIPPELRAEIAEDIANGKRPQALVTVSDKGVTISFRPSNGPAITWGVPIIGERA